MSTMKDFEEFLKHDMQEKVQIKEGSESLVLKNDKELWKRLAHFIDNLDKQDSNSLERVVNLLFDYLAVDVCEPYENREHDISTNRYYTYFYFAGLEDWYSWQYLKPDDLRIREVLRHQAGSNQPLLETINDNRHFKEGYEKGIDINDANKVYVFLKENASLLSPTSKQTICMEVDWGFNLWKRAIKDLNL